MNIKQLLLGAVAGVAFAASASAQQVVPNTLSGNECWNAGQGPGGTSIGFMCAYLIRNGAAQTIITGTGAVTTLTTPQQSTLMWHGAAPTTWTITTPATPFDGQILTIGTDTTLTTIVTLTANTNQTLSSAFTAQTLTATSSAEYQYNLASTVWYRLR